MRNIGSMQCYWEEEEKHSDMELAGQFATTNLYFSFTAEI